MDKSKKASQYAEISVTNLNGTILVCAQDMLVAVTRLQPQHISKKITNLTSKYPVYMDAIAKYGVVSSYHTDIYQTVQLLDWIRMDRTYKIILCKVFGDETYNKFEELTHKKVSNTTEPAMIRVHENVKVVLNNVNVCFNGSHEQCQRMMMDQPEPIIVAPAMLLAEQQQRQDKDDFEQKRKQQKHVFDQQQQQEKHVSGQKQRQEKREEEQQRVQAKREELTVLKELDITSQQLAMTKLAEQANQHEFKSKTKRDNREEQAKQDASDQQKKQTNLDFENQKAQTKLDLENQKAQTKLDLEQQQYNFDQKKAKDNREEQERQYAFEQKAMIEALQSAVSVHDLCVKYARTEADKENYGLILKEQMMRINPLVFRPLVQQNQEDFASMVSRSVSMSALRDSTGAVVQGLIKSFEHELTKQEKTDANRARKMENSERIRKNKADKDEIAESNREKKAAKKRLTGK